MPKKDSLTEVRRENFRAYCRKHDWINPNGTWRISAIAPAIGKLPQKASDLLNKGSFGAQIAREIEATLGMDSGSLDGIGETEGFVEIRQTDVRASAGNGSLPQWEEEEIGGLKFRRDFLRSVGVTERNAALVTVRGFSMHPTIRDGATLLVNKDNREPHQDLFFVFWRPDEGLVVKRTVKMNDRWMATSDNDDRKQYPDFPFGNDQRLLGRAVWMGTKL